MNKMNTLAFVNFLLVKLFPTLIRQNFPPSKICAIRYALQLSVSPQIIMLYLLCIQNFFDYSIRVTHLQYLTALIECLTVLLECIYLLSLMYYNFLDYTTPCKMPRIDNF